MLKFIVDENFNNIILRGVLRRQRELDIVRVQDVGLLGAEDPIILEWAAQEGRILLTHDVRTMTAFLNERINEGKFSPGIIAFRREDVPVGIAIEDILLIAEYSDSIEWENQVNYLPLK